MDKVLNRELYSTCSILIYIYGIDLHIWRNYYGYFVSNWYSVSFADSIGQVGMTSLQVNCSLAEVNASVFIAVF